MSATIEEGAYQAMPSVWLREWPGRCSAPTGVLNTIRMRVSDHTNFFIKQIHSYHRRFISTPSDVDWALGCFATVFAFEATAYSVLEKQAVIHVNILRGGPMHEEVRMPYLVFTTEKLSEEQGALSWFCHCKNDN